MEECFVYISPIKMRQLVLEARNGWGGRRSGSGRRRLGVRSSTPHRARPAHRARNPVHVTLRSAVRSLRTQFVFPTVRGAISAAARALPGFRVVEFSVQGTHLHLLVEAANKERLSSGMRGLAIRIARRVNQLLFRRGRFWADRWHGRALTSPRAVRHALIYVLHNAKKHGSSGNRAIDPYSSAPYFLGYKELPDTAPIDVSATVVPVALAPPATSPVLSARTWLLRHGWLQRHGRLSVADVPKR